MQVHIVFATKHRKPTISKAWRDELHAVLGGSLKSQDAMPLAIGGTEDHVHLLVGLKGKHAVADLVRDVKVTSHEWADSRWKGFAWQGGYAALSVAKSEVDRVKNYIANQEEHHRKMTSIDELRAILIEAGIEIDERFFE